LHGDNLSPIVNGIIAYSDNEHLSAAMVRSLRPEVSEAHNGLGLQHLSGVPFLVKE
jgi:hypothetical protein